MDALEWLAHDQELRDNILRNLSTIHIPDSLRGQLTVEDVRDFITDYEPDPRSVRGAGVRVARFPAAIVVQHAGRPVLLVRNDTFEDPSDEVLCRRLHTVRGNIEAAIPAVGRIEVQNYPDPNRTWVGTGWLAAENLVVTNHHVAQEFAEQQDGHFILKKNPENECPIGCCIDFREEYYVQTGALEHSPTAIAEFRITDIRHLDAECDMALLMVEHTSPQGLNLPAPIRITSAAPAISPPDTIDIVVIGYPSNEAHYEETYPIVLEIFGNIFDVKRLAPGRIMDVIDDVVLHHDCSTLGGNSGSVILDVKTGEAVGMHCKGDFFDKNYAIPATKIRACLEQYL